MILRCYFTNLSFRTTCLLPLVAFARMFATIRSVSSNADSINNLSLLMLLQSEYKPWYVMKSILLFNLIFDTKALLLIAEM